MSIQKKTEPKTYTADELRYMIMVRHGRPMEWVVLSEVSNGTGAGVDRRVDVLALSAWPSSGFKRIAYEIKISRSDFLRELADAGKRRWSEEIAHEFWFVMPLECAKPEEIPKGCGWYVPGKSGLRRHVIAQQQKPRALHDMEIMGLLRNAAKMEKAVSARWKYLGKELTNEALDELLAEKQDYYFQRRVQSEASRQMEQDRKEIAATFARYCDALEEAGVKAPSWMRTPFSQHGWWGDASAWVRDNVVPGPHNTAVQRAIEAINSAAVAVSKAQKAMREKFPRVEDGRADFREE